MGLGDVPDQPNHRAASVPGKGFIDVAVEPPFALLCRSDHRMAAAVGMLACVAIGGRVATTRDATGLAGAKVHPPGTCSYTLVAFAHLRLPDRGHDVEVMTLCLGIHRNMSLSRQ